VLDLYENKPLPLQKKLLFDICDSDKDGLINSSELYTILELLIGSELNKDEIKELAIKTLNEFSINQQSLSYEEFIKILD